MNRRRQRAAGSWPSGDGFLGVGIQHKRPVGDNEDMSSARGDALRPGWRLQFLRLGLLVFLSVFAFGWTVGGVFAVRVLWRHGNHPTVAIFLGAWLLLWAVIPVWLAFSASRHRQRRIHPTSEWSARFFFGCTVVAWCAGLAAIVSRDHLGESLLVVAFTAFFLLFGIDAALHRQNVSVDPLALEIRDSWGRLRRTSRYELRLIRNPRIERPSDSEGGVYPFWEVAFDYESKTVRFGRFSWREAEQHRALLDFRHVDPPTCGSLVYARAITNLPTVSVTATGEPAVDPEMCEPGGV